MAASLDRILQILRCPETGKPLKHDGSRLKTDCGREYPIINGKPILVRNIQTIHITPPDQRIVSKNATSFEPEGIPEDPNFMLLHLGCGDVPSEDPRVISMDVLPNNAVDIVAEAEALPFATCSINRVISDAVFEHVYDPRKAAAEVRRVLKENGTFFICTAFNQGYHGFPGHYFNMTPQAAETYIIDDFIVEDAGPSHPYGAIHTVYHGIHFLLEKLPEIDRQKCLEQSLGEFLASMDNVTVPQQFGSRMHEFVLRSLGATTTVCGKKPIGYDDLSIEATKRIGSDRYAALKRDYYTLRTAVIREHGSVMYWKMRAVEDEGCPLAEGPEDPVDFREILQAGVVQNPFEEEAWETAKNYFDSEKSKLIDIRDRWITLFLSRQDRRRNESTML